MPRLPAFYLLGKIKISVGRQLLDIAAGTAASYEMSFAAVQKHVAVLAAAGLVHKHAHGRERIVRGNPDVIRRAQALLDSYEQLWRARIAGLDALLAVGT